MTENAIFTWVLRAAYAGRRELSLAIGSRRGRMLAGALLLCAALPSGIRAWTDSRASMGVLPRQQVASISTLYGVEVARDLAAYPPALVSLCILTLLGIPLVMLIAGHDGIARDVADRTMRSSLLRAPSGSIIAGKFIGLWLTVAVIFMLCQVLVAVAVAVVAGGTVLPSIGASLRLWSACAIAAAPYGALALLTSALVASSARSLILGFTVIVTLVFVRINHVFSPELASWLLPSENDAQLLRTNWQSVASASLRVGVWTWLALIASTACLKRRAV